MGASTTRTQRLSAVVGAGAALVGGVWAWSVAWNARTADEQAVVDAAWSAPVGCFWVTESGAQATSGELAARWRTAGWMKGVYVDPVQRGVFVVFHVPPGTSGTQGVLPQSRMTRLVPATPGTDAYSCVPGG